MWRELRIDRAARQTQTDMSTGDYSFRNGRKRDFVSEGDEG